MEQLALADVVRLSNYVPQKVFSRYESFETFHSTLKLKISKTPFKKIFRSLRRGKFFF